MNLSLLVQLCGVPLLIVITGCSLLLTLFACYLAFAARQEKLLAAFLPICAIPLVAATISAFVGLLSNIALQLDANSDYAIDSSFALQMSFVPILFGLLAGLPPASITIVARWLLAWRESGLEWIPQVASESLATTETPAEEWESQEADAYLEKVSRPR